MPPQAPQLKHPTRQNNLLPKQRTLPHNSKRRTVKQLLLIDRSLTQSLRMQEPAMEPRLMVPLVNSSTSMATVATLPSQPLPVQIPIH